MDGDEFERFVQKRLEDAGWSARLTKASNDFGADVICEFGSETLIVQCKCYSEGSSLGIAAVQEVYTAKAHYNGTHAVVIYRGRTSRSAKILAESTGVELFHEREVRPGWKYDRSREGAEIRRLEAQRILQKKHTEEAARLVEEKKKYDLERQIFDKELAEWNSAKKSWPTFKFLSAAIFIGYLIVSVSQDASSKDGHWGVLLFWPTLVLLGYILLSRNPGSQPIAPALPNAVAGSVQSLSTATASIGRPLPAQQQPKASQPTGGGAPRLNSGSTRIVSCPDCSTPLRVPDDRALIVTCPKCKASRTISREGVWFRQREQLPRKPNYDGDILLARQISKIIQHFNRLGWVCEFKDGFWEIKELGGRAHRLEPVQLVAFAQRRVIGLDVVLTSNDQHVPDRPVKPTEKPNSSENGDDPDERPLEEGGSLERILGTFDDGHSEHIAAEKLRRAGGYVINRTENGWLVNGFHFTGQKLIELSIR